MNFKKNILFCFIFFLIMTFTSCGKKDFQNDNIVTNSNDLKVEDTFTQFIVNTNKDEVFDLSKSKKAKLVNFWATWCGPCRAEMPDLEKAYKKYNDKVDFIMINCGETRDEVNQFTEQNKYTFPIGYDEKDELSMKYNIVGIPTTYFLDKNNKIVYISIGSMDDKTINNYLEKITE